jgi:branched-chain amino acid transport system substrate-binding protein
MSTISKFASGAISRRAIVKVGLGAIAAPAVLRAIPVNAQSRVIKIGLVTPRTGPLAAYGEPDQFVLGEIQKVLAKGIVCGGKTYEVQIIVKDSQSHASRASEVASELILRDKVDLLTAACTPDTTNPAADQAEANEVPCVTTLTPWQPHFFGRKGDPAKGFTWTYHFYWGLENVIAAFMALWNSVPTNKVIGGLFPNDADGNAWGSDQMGFPRALKQAGYRLIDTGRFQPFSDDYTAQITAFKNAGVEIVTGNLTPPDFATFWSQAGQQGLKPKVCTIGKALLFPSSVGSMGERGNGLTTEVWWTPTHPFKSSLTGATPRELCNGYTKATGREWTQPIGYKYALLEVAIDVLKRSKNLEPKAILESIRNTDYDSIVGHVKWTGTPVKNVTRTPLVAGQWKRKDGKLNLAVTTNAPAPEIPVGGPLEMLPS